MTRKFLILLASSLLTFAASAQDDIERDDESEDETEIRENPVIDGIDDDFDIVVPSFIKKGKNHINLNGADWSKLRSALARSYAQPANIIHIGDSHLQADYATSEIRNNLQYDFGNAGRGLITPLRLSSTNQPVDYSFSSTLSWNAVRLMSQNWPRTMGFTGTSITPVNPRSNFLVATSETTDYNPFSAITVFHNGQFYVTSVTDADGNLIPFQAEPSKNYTHISLSRDVTAARIYFDSAGDLTLFGANLSGNRPGLFYHTIGNNGAAYSTYNRIGKIGEGIAPIHPDLVIISLGTNEAFGRSNAGSIKNEIDRLVKDIRHANPETAILLVTPMECQRIVYTTVKGRKKKGRRRRSSRRVKGYSVNDNVERVRDVIVNYGKENHIPVYDWYTVAGGDGASNKWIKDGLFSGDRIHHSIKGYKLQGLLMYQALREAFSHSK